jgi:hypothetical protein
MLTEIAVRRVQAARRPGLPAADRETERPAGEGVHDRSGCVGQVRSAVALMHTDDHHEECGDCGAGQEGDLVPSRIHRTPQVCPPSIEVVFHDSIAPDASVISNELTMQMQCNL